VSDLPAQPVDEFFTDDLTVEAIFHPAAGPDRTISIMFDRDYSPVELANAAFEGRTPVATCRHVDVYDADNTCTLTIGGKVWKIISVQPDGTGITRFALSREGSESLVFPPSQPLDEFFTDDLTVEAIFHPAAGPDRFVRVIFDREFSLMELGNAAFEGTAPVATCREADVSDADNACTLTIGGDDWKITSVQPDGTGITRLVLSKD